MTSEKYEIGRRNITTETSEALVSEFNETSDSWKWTRSTSGEKALQGDTLEVPSLFRPANYEPKYRDKFPDIVRVKMQPEPKESARDAAMLGIQSGVKKFSETGNSDGKDLTEHTQVNPMNNFDPYMFNVNFAESADVMEDQTFEVNEPERPHPTKHIPDSIIEKKYTIYEPGNEPKQQKPDKHDGLDAKLRD